MLSPLPRPNHGLQVILGSTPLLIRDGGLPHRTGGSAWTLIFSRPAQRSLTLRPAHSRGCLTALYVEGFRRFVTSTTASTATGWNDSTSRTGLTPVEHLHLSSRRTVRPIFVGVRPVFFAECPSSFATDGSHG